MYFVTILGTAGSGKSTLTASLANYLQDNDLDVATVNLDPAVEKLPYIPDVDTREYVSYWEVMESLGLGPNGALIVTIDKLLEVLDDLVDEIESLRVNYVILDTPGQMELFALRDTGPAVIRTLVGESKNVTLFLIDATQAVKPECLVSSLLLSASVNLRIRFPQINVVTKIDLLKKMDVERLNSFFEDYYSILEDSDEILLWSGEDLAYILEKINVMDSVMVSSTKMTGFEELYAAIQRVLAGGEDYLTEEPSPRL